MNGYEKYAGKCKEYAEAEASKNTNLEVVRGWYFCPIWSEKRQHWWCKDKKTGEIIDPTREQFPSKGHGIYEEFDGWVDCDNCGKRIRLETASTEGRFAFCCDLCHGQFVGVY